MKQENEYLTKDKFEELTKELEHLRTVRRKEVAQDLEYAKQLGDLSENAEYHQAREEQAVLEERINKIDTLLKSASIVSSHETSTVTVGCKVVIQKEGKKETVTYMIVGSEEADMSQNKLSSASPLGVAVLGKKKGESFNLKTPSGNVTYKVVDIS